MADDVLSEEDKNMLSYFWEAKGDLERWSSWDEARIEKCAPHIVKAWRDYKAAERIMNLVISDMKENG